MELLKPGGSADRLHNPYTLRGHSVQVAVVIKLIDVGKNAQSLPSLAGSVSNLGVALDPRVTQEYVV